MPTVGIVCEYNPFHKGHLYLLEEVRRRLGNDVTVVCAMSGDFVQRGEAALFDKCIRAEAACRCGSDLVLELPLPWSLSSAEGFASGAISMLSAVGCDMIAFGSESGDLKKLDRLAAFLLDPSVLSRIRELMDQDETLSFAAARQRAASEMLGEEAELLAQPNDILAVEYLKANKRAGRMMDALAIPRTGSGHDSTESGIYRSAMQLRRMLKRGECVSAFIPFEAMTVFHRAMENRRIIRAEYLEIALLSRVYGLNAEAFERLPDAHGGAGRRLLKAVEHGGGLEQIAAAASTKRYTVSRMRRMLYCAALNISAEDTKGSPPYLRVLAANERGRTLLRAKRESTVLPIIMRPAAVRKLGHLCSDVFCLGSRAHDFYRLACGDIDGFIPDEDWKTMPAIV